MGRDGTARRLVHNARMPRLELFPFRYRDELTRKWVRARYVAERHEIAERFAEWEIIGPPEIRNPHPDDGYFTPWKAEQKTVADCIANVGPIIELAGWTVVP